MSQSTGTPALGAVASADDAPPSSVRPKRNAPGLELELDRRCLLLDKLLEGGQFQHSTPPEFLKCHGRNLKSTLLSYKNASANLAERFAKKYG